MPSPSRPLPTILLYGLSLLSAFLLFQVQPVISKFILPWFGGSPGVWTTCMLFFQCVLFLGYAYAHLLTLLPRRTQWIVHGLLILAAAATLPISPAESWKPVGNEPPEGRILLLLLATVGLPYFVLSSTSPLVQVWFNRSNPGGRPWRLYALSNVGSLVALLSYPFFFERQLDVLQQTLLWSVAFGLFVVFSLLCVWKDKAVTEVNGPISTEDDRPEPPVRWWQRLLWVILPACATALLLAATNHVCQDVAVIPFLWVVPLSLYLITFIICFDHERWYQPWFWGILAIGAIFLASGYHLIPDDLKLPYVVGDLEKISLSWLNNYRAELAICFGAMFFGCMVCHGELVRLKPSPRHLTQFYLLMSAGGALGGLTVSLVAPRVFDRYVEWPIGLMVMLGIACLALLHQAFTSHSSGAKTILSLVAGIAGVAGFMLLGTWGFEEEARIARARNFYGAISVFEDFDTEYGEKYRQLYHGGIIHGLQNMGPGDREEPVSYYGHHTGIGKALDNFATKPNARVGIVGMGTATALVYGKAGHTFRIYEINPQIIEFSKKYFTYQDDFIARGGHLDIVQGDARLNLEREEDQHYDVLLLDAFSGDSVPVHLLTIEAFKIYQRHMNDDGIIAVHVTNRYLSLAPVIEKIASGLGMKTTRIQTDSNGDHDITDYVLVTKNDPFLIANPPESPWDEEQPLKVDAWTDNRHNLFEVLDVD